ncbi:hypothetical protein BST81_25945 [Leptolyngbya sp. 'hensonii']|nr:hypothetical protein BST81_25945 [Leptolyngbya sp. 'hensonii']
MIEIPEDLDPKQILQQQQVRPLPGQLDEIPVFNSNSPEVVLTEGILLSTFSPEGKLFPQAHLNFAFKGRFDVFAHHISRARTPQELRSLVMGIIMYNPGPESVTVEVLEAASYLTRPDALFVNLPPAIEDPLGRVYSGPGSRTMNDILRGRRQGNWPSTFEIPPGGYQMLMNLPLPAGLMLPTSNGRTTLIRLRSNGPVYLASMAMYAPKNETAEERLPTLEEWQNFLNTANLAGPRDLPPSPPDRKLTGPIIYGRVAGVAVGSEWKTWLTDKPIGEKLTIPQAGQAFSYALSTVPRGTLGTNQVQSARILARYADTAYQANGNYGIQYSLTIPLYNPTSQPQSVTLMFQTPVKEDRIRGGLRFFDPPEPQVFFRGPVRFRYRDDQGVVQTQYFHLVQQRGQQGEPLLTLTLQPGERRLVQVDFLYPPDSTPPQVLTIRTLDQVQNVSR